MPLIVPDTFAALLDFTLDMSLAPGHVHINRNRVLAPMHGLIKTVHAVKVQDSSRARTIYIVLFLKGLSIFIIQLKACAPRNEAKFCIQASFLRTSLC